MQNDIPSHQLPDLNQPESGATADKDLHPFSSADDGVNFWLQPAGTWKERSVPASIILVLLGAAPALLTWRDPEGRAERTPVSGETVWFIPAGTPFSAHWHGPLAIASLGLASPGGCMPSRIFRLADLARLDWDLTHLARRFCQAGEIGREEAMALARRVAAILQENETHWRSVGLSSERLHATTDYIEDHLAQKLSRELLARADGQSLHHFARMFKLRTGRSLREYISLRRCFRARELIASGVRLVDAAATVGFCDQPEMSRKFNQVFGCPPGTFVPADPC